MVARRHPPATARQARARIRACGGSCSATSTGLAARRPFGARETEMIAQRRARIFAPVEAAALQLGHDQVDEVIERAGEIGGHDDEAVRPLGGEPLLENVRD